jgi:hypothetical protein
MVDETQDTSFGSTVRAFAFDGDETKFRAWEGKTLALAGSKGFLLALTRAEVVRGLTVEEYEYGEVAVPLLTATPVGEVPAGGLTAVHPTMRRQRLRRTVSTWHALLHGLTWSPAAPTRHTL